MIEPLAKLVEIASDPFCPPATADRQTGYSWPVWRRLLSLKNGFFAFESALHVFPTETVMLSWGIADWNSASLWKADYFGLADNLFCFAEDIFGGQFCISESGVHRFDPETGALEQVADDLAGWAYRLLSDFDGMTGYGTGHAWQVANGPLPPRFRLMPKQPFVLGGTSELTNLVAIDSVRLMRNMGNLARQIHDLPDGSKIKFEIIQ